MGNYPSYEEAKKKARKGGKSLKPIERSIDDVLVAIEKADVDGGVLDLSANDPEGGLECLSIEAMVFLREKLESGMQVRGLLLTWNVVGCHGAELLVNCLATQENLSILDISWNGLGTEGALDFAQGLKDGAMSLTTLNLSGNNICDEGCVAIATALKSNRKISKLVLRHNSIKRTGSVAIGSILKFNGTLVHLDIGDNSIGCKGAIAIAEGLAENGVLLVLSLNSNGISCDGAEALADALTKNATLKSLALVRNSIDRRGAKALADAMGKNTTLIRLALRGNFGVKEEALSAISTALERNVDKPLGMLTCALSVSSAC